MVTFLGNFKVQPILTLAGKVVVNAPNRHFSRRPTEYILYIISEGQMNIKEGGIVYSLKSGDVMLLDPSREHVGILGNYSVSYYYIHFQWESFHEITTPNDHIIGCEAIDGKMEDQLTLIKYCHLAESAKDIIIGLADEILKTEAGVENYKKILNQCQLIRLLIAIRENTNESYEKSGNGEMPLYQKIQKYLRTNYQSHITSEDISKALHSNFDYLNRKFKEDTGKTIFHYLKELRLEESKKMIQSGAYTMSQISESCGFCNAYYFSRVFSKEYHMSPMDYRKKFR